MEGMMLQAGIDVNMAQQYALPEEVLSILPNDLFEQLQLAHRISNYAFSQRVCSLEGEIRHLRQAAASKANQMKSLETRLTTCQLELQDVLEKARQHTEVENRLCQEKATLLGTVKKLTDEAVKLSEFKKNLLQTLQGSDEGSTLDAKPKACHQTLHGIRSPVPEVWSHTVPGEPHPCSASSPSPLHQLRSNNTPDASCYAGDNAYVNGTARSGDCLQYVDRHSCVTCSPGIAAPAYLPEDHWSRMRQEERDRCTTSGPDKCLDPGCTSMYRSATAANAGPSTASGTQPKLNGKDFFRHARARLPNDQFSRFLQIIKELNSGKRTREDSLNHAQEIFGPANLDLYDAFETLLICHVPSM